jgi:pfkB domain protein
MIVSIGEILADMIGEEQDGVTAFKMYGGGAPFNVAVNAKRAGAKAGFVGRVGRDLVGTFLKKFAAGAGLERCEIQTDAERNTTLAFVTLKEGEREFAFFRHDTADFHIDEREMNWEQYEDLNIVHLGSLMLSEREGREFASSMVKKIRKSGKVFSFDVNFRMDLYGDIEEAKRAYAPYIEEADILKFSEDELAAFTGKESFKDGVESVFRPGRLLLVTLGSKGSYYRIDDREGRVETVPVKPVDTTGAGDAFYGAALAGLDGKNLMELTDGELRRILQKANEAGAAATQHKGALAL